MRNSELKKIKALLVDSEDYRKYLYPDQTWERFEAYWMAKYNVSGDILPLPTLVNYGQRSLAATIGDIPRIEITSADPRQFAAAAVMTIKANQMVEQFKLLRQLRAAAKDTVTLGTGILQDYFGSQYGVHPQTILKGYDPSRYSKDNERIEYHESIEEDMPASLRVHPTDVFFPPGTVDLPSAYGCFVQYLRPLEEVRADTKLSARHRQAIEADGLVEYRRPGVTAHDFQSLKEMVLMVDWFDLRNNHRVTFNRNYNSVLYDDTDEMLLRLGRLPFHALIFTPNSRMLWGTADFDLAEPLANEINDIRTMQSILRHGEIPKIIYNRDMITNPDDLEEMEKFKKALLTDMPNTMYGVSGDPNVFMKQFMPGQPYDLVGQYNLCQENLEQIFGLGPNQQGMMSQGRHTGYEASLAESHWDRGIMPRRLVIQEAITDIIQNWFKLCFTFWTKPQIVETRDVSGNSILVEFTGADLQGDYRYQVSLESMQTRSQQERIAEANMIYERAMPLVQAGVINPANLFRQYLMHVNRNWDLDALVPAPPRPNGPPQPFGQYAQQMQQQPPAMANIADIGQRLAMMQGKGGGQSASMGPSGGQPIPPGGG